MKTILETSEALRTGKTTSLALTADYLAAIEAQNPTLNAYITVLAEEAKAAAIASDARREKGHARGDLDGIPLALKDNLAMQGTRTTAGSAILTDYLAPYDATVVTKLKEAGAVILGKANMDEFAMGSSCENSAYGPTKNPVDLERVPGGSSGGSAAAVAGDLCVAAIGSDTGGSIRQPAAFCGIVGFKPSYGRISRSGLIAMASSLDQVGPMTNTVADTRALYEVMQGADTLDQTTEHMPDEKPAVSLKGKRIGMPRIAWGEGMTAEVRAATSHAVEAMREQGAEIVDVDLPYADAALAVYYILMPCEVSANLSRFDGIRYGKRADVTNLLDTYMLSRSQSLGTEVKRRILLGTYALSKGYYDAYYRQARKVQTLIRRAYNKAFESVDALVTPTAPSVAFKLGEKTNDPLAMYLEDVFTVGVNVAGLPAISLPCKTPGLPVGLQLIGKRFDDQKLLALAEAAEGVVR